MADVLDRPPVQTGTKRGQADRDPKTGHFLPGVSRPAGPGRPRLPAWLKDRGEDALLVTYACATGVVLEGAPPAAAIVAAESDAKTRIAAASEIADRVYGRPIAAPPVERHEEPAVEDTAVRVAQLEGVLAQLAAQGDRAAALALLAALDPVRYASGTRATPPAQAEHVDVVDFGPMVVQAPPSSPAPETPSPEPAAAPSEPAGGTQGDGDGWGWGAE
jgi:hypothetical protein